MVVFVGDTLSFLTEMNLTSCLHRVVPVSNSKEVRFSVTFLKRPELEATFTDGAGKDWQALDWHMAKYKIFRENNSEQSKSSLLTGREGFLGQVCL